MPWTMQDALKKTKKANTSSRKKMWAKVANSVLKRGGGDASAVRIANAAVKRAARSK